MGNFKIKVSSEAESKEAQELFFDLGYGFDGNEIKEIQEFEYTGVFYLFAYGDDQDLTHSSDRELFNSKMHKEVILPELRAMVNPSLNDQYAEIEQVRQDGLKFDNGKPRHSLLPKGSISSIIAVLEFGAKKYEANNWQKVDNAKERYYDAAMRHIDSWWNGEKIDQETGIHHLAHAATNLFFLKWFNDKENNNG